MQGYLRYRFRLLDASGRELRRTRWRTSYSFVQQYMQHLKSAFHRSALAGVVDTDGTSRTIREPDASTTGFLGLDAAAASALFGIVVGSGTTAVAMTDYALATLIAHGVGAGQLQYSGQTIGAFTQSGDDAWVVLTRTFTNGSGATVTVAEVGIYCFTQDTGAASRYFLIVRDILPSAVDVPDGQSLAVDYTIKISV